MSPDMQYIIILILITCSIFLFTTFFVDVTELGLPKGVRNIVFPLQLLLISVIAISAVALLETEEITKNIPSCHTVIINDVEYVPIDCKDTP